MMIVERIRQHQRRIERAISHRPDLAGRVHVLTTGYGQSDVTQELDDYVSYGKVYAVYVWVRKAISKIAEAIAPLPVVVVDSDGQTLSEHPLTGLFARMNPKDPPSHIWGTWVIHKMLGGEAFFEIVPSRSGQPVQLWLRRPDEVLVVPDEANPLYPRPAGYEWKDEKYGPDEMIHDRVYNPLSEWRGMAPITAVRAGVTIDIYAQAWSRRLLRSGARPDWALIAPAGLTQSERDAYSDALMDKYGGSDNWHKPIVLEQGITDVKILSWPPSDVQWLEQRKFNRDEVGGLFGVPDIIMGYGNETYDTEEKIRSGMYAFWSLTLLPLVRSRDALLTHFFRIQRPMLSEREFIETDISSVGILQEDITKKAIAAQTFWQMGYPLNVIDERLGLGFGRVQGGDTGYVPFNVMPVTSVEAPQELAAEGVRPLPTIRHKSAVPEYGSARHKALWKASVALFRPYERRMMGMLDRDFEKQRVATRESQSQLREETVSSWLAKQREGQVPSEADQFFSVEEWAAYFATAYEQIYSDVSRASGEAFLSQFGLDMPFDLHNERLHRAIRMMRVKFAEDINGETLRMLDQMLRELLTEAADEGWGVFTIQEELGKRTDDVFGLRRELWQRERIARTEMHKASELANFDAAVQSGLELKKGWLSALDGRERETHREAHLRYQPAPIGRDELFEVGADTMSAPGLGREPAENVNCRCSKFWVLAEAEV